MTGLFCFELAVLSSPFESKLGLKLRTRCFEHQLILLKRRLQVASGSPTQEMGQFDDVAAAFRGVDERIRDWPVSIAGERTRCWPVRASGAGCRSARRVGAAIGPQVCNVLRHRTRPGRPRSERCRLRVAQQCFRRKIELAGLVASRPALERTTLRSTIYAVGQPNEISAVVRRSRVALSVLRSLLVFPD
jgi:hypothetical protein